MSGRVNLLCDGDSAVKGDLSVITALRLPVGFHHYSEYQMESFSVPASLTGNFARKVLRRCRALSHSEKLQDHQVQKVRCPAKEQT